MKLDIKPNKEMDNKVQSEEKTSVAQNSIEAKLAEKYNINVNDSIYEDEDLDKEYKDERKIIISLVNNYSNYRKVNMKVMGQKVENIGSSVTSCRVLSSNMGEVEAYFPTLIGLSPNNPEFITRVKAWLSNIKFSVTSVDTALDISFIYKTKRDYLKVLKAEESIEDEYNKVDRSNLSALREALKIKLDKINALESDKYKVGKPVNVEQYLMYRHCLLYRDVAKDIAFINEDPNIRFYIKDEVKEAEKKKKLIEQRTKAMRSFVELNSNKEKFNAVYVSICTFYNKNIAEALLKDETIKQDVVINFVNNQPEKFNKMVRDNNIITKAFIETLIIRGELIRSEFNQQISTADGTFIGANLNEAVAYFNNPNNAAIKSAYENKLKQF